MADATKTTERTVRLKQILREQQELKLAEAAVARGLLAREQLEAALEEQAEREPVDGHAVPLEDILCARGFITTEAIAALKDEMGRQDFERSANASAAPLPPEALEASGMAGRRLGADFVLVTLLGQGGAGQVWKAWDRRLARWVAVKIPAVSLNARIVRERFHREALASARLDHPHIVPVYQTGEHDGRPYLVMPYIHGRTLERLDLPLRQALEIMRTVALAVAHAHQKGLVHRDLKPGNLMLDDAGRVMVLDFGLVYLLEDETSKLTAPGDVFGTAAYMAPEQAEGSARAREPATDVYGLGATLYHLVAGRAPFVGDSFAAIVAHVLQRDPTPPDVVNRAVPHDVATVILKAMDKDPARRYGSASELAEDLRRLLDDEPIAARSVGAVERWWRGTRRFRLVGGVTAGALAVIIAGAGIAQSRLARERAAALASMRELARSSLATALRLRRAGDAAGMRQMLPQLERAYDEARRRAPDLPELDYLLGRMHRALMDEDRALALQQRALEKDPTHAPSLYERAVLLSRRYGREVNRALGWSRAIGGRAPQRAQPGRMPARAEEAARRNPELARLRETILRDLGALERPNAGAESGLGPAAIRAARGIFAYHQGRADEAVGALRAALAVDPDMEEAWETLAAAEEAHGSIDSADGIYTKAIARDRGYAPLWVGRCRARISREAKHADGEEDATNAIKLMPTLTEAWLCRGMVRVFRAYGAFLSGGDALPLLGAAEGDFTRAVALDGRSWGAFWGRASVHRYRAIVRARRGEDTSSDLQAALTDVERARALAADEAQVWALRARIRLTAAAGELAARRDPGALVASALQDLDRAVSHAPELGDLREWRAEAHALVGSFRAVRGEDAGAELERAASELDAVITGVRGSRAALLARGRVRTALGARAALRGEDPRPIWEGAEDDLSRAIDRKRDYADAWLARGTLHVERAAFARRKGRSVRADIEAARSDLARALAIDQGLREVPAGADALVRLRRLGGAAP